MFGIGIFYVFKIILKEVSYAHQATFVWWRKNSNIGKYYNL